MRLAVTLALILAGLHVVPASAQAARSIPARIDASGHRDVTTALQRFLNTVSNGETVVFGRGATYRLDGTVQLRDRAGITLDGNGASLVAGTHGGPNRAAVRLLDGSAWTIRDLHVVGADPTGRFEAKYQWQHGFDLRGVDGATLVHVSVTDVFGDDVYVGKSITSARWSQNVSVLNSTGIRSGRMAISIVAGRGVTVRGGFWSKPAFTTFDIEPNRIGSGADRVLIEGTTVGPEGRFRGTELRLGGGLISTGSALAMIGGGPISNVTLRDNRLTGRALHVVAEQPSYLRPRNIVVQNNVSTVSFAGPAPAAMYFRNVDGLAVTGNRQRIGPGNFPLVATRGSTRVRVSNQGAYRDLTPIGSRKPYVVAGAVALLLSFGIYRTLKRARSRAGRGVAPGDGLAQPDAVPSSSPTKRR